MTLTKVCTAVVYLTHAVLVYIVARLEVIYAMTRDLAAGGGCEDMLPASRIPSIALGDSSDRILAEIDQDGFLFAIDQRDTAVFNTRAVMRERTHHRIQIVLRGGMVLLRKTALRQRHTQAIYRFFAFLRWEFYVEAAALLRLRGMARVPQIRRLHTREGWIEMDYIWGRDLRQILAGNSSEIVSEEISRLFSDLVSVGEGDETSRRLVSTVIEIIERGVIPRDVHAANFIVTVQVVGAVLSSEGTGWVLRCERMAMPR